MSTLETLLAKCATDAARVLMLREALELEKLESLATSRRFLDRARRAEKAIAKARKLMRAEADYPGATIISPAYCALDWRQR